MSSNVGIRESISDASLVKVDGVPVATSSTAETTIVASDSSVNVSIESVFGDSRMSENIPSGSHVSIERKELKMVYVADSSAFVPGTNAICVYPPRTDGDMEIAKTRMVAYIEFLRQLDGHGCKIAARDGSIGFRPRDFDSLQQHMDDEGVDIGYKLAVLEKPMVAEPANRIVEILDVNVDHERSQYAIVVLIRIPHSGLGAVCHEGACAFKRISRTSLKCAIEDLFNAPGFRKALSGG